MRLGTLVGLGSICSTCTTCIGQPAPSSAVNNFSDVVALLIDIPLIKLVHSDLHSSQITRFTSFCPG